MKTKCFLLLLIVSFLISCGPKLSGKDEESFKASKAKMEEKLDKVDKEKLEIALRMVAMKAMKEKWNKPDDAKYKGKSFDKISMVMVDGKTFSGIVSYAEDFLKEDRDTEIKNANKTIDSLTKMKTKFNAQNSMLDKLVLKKMSIIAERSFGEKTPTVECVFVNNTRSEILGYMIRVKVNSKKDGKQLSWNESGNRSEIDESVKDGDGVQPGEEIYITQSLYGIGEAAESLKNAKYPITDLAKLNFVVQSFPTVVITRKEKMVRVDEIENLDKEIAELQLQLKELKATKGTLDELELTK